MSEYQYYEFRAIDRPLNKKELSELAALSSRAQITPVSFVNTYNWGNFKGDPLKLMEKYFDAFVYLANWGTRQLMLRLPTRLCELEALDPYLSGDVVEVVQKGENLILQFLSEEEPEDWEEGESWMASLMPLRDELMHGDMRCMYISWLSAAQSGQLPDDEEEPAVPPGLRNLSSALQTFSEFMRIDSDLIEVAGMASSDLEISVPSKDDLKAWISAMPDTEKNAVLLKLLEQNDPLVRTELLKQFHTDMGSRNKTQPRAGKARTVEELLSASQSLAAERERREGARRAAEAARRKEEQMAARTKQLKQLEGRESEIWQRIADLIQSSRPADYDRAVALLVDLRDLASQKRQTSEFKSRLSGLRQRYSSRPSFQKRLIKADLGDSPPVRLKKIL